MPTNEGIALLLEDIANLLEIDDESPFRIMAHRNAADTVRYHTEALAELVRAGEDLTSLEHVGPGMAQKVADIVRLGIDAYREQLAAETGPGLLELLRIPGLGPKRVRKLREALGVSSVAALRAALAAKKVRGVPGFGPGTEERLRRRLAKPDGEESPSAAPESE